MAIIRCVGRAIVQRQKDERRGKSVVERLAKGLRAEFPDTGGFSRQNIWYMRSFYLSWHQGLPILQQPVGERANRKLPQPMAETPPEPLGNIPWGHNIVLLERLKDADTRLWYARQIIANGWSRAMLVHWIESRLHTRQGKAVTNFKTALPAPQSDLAQQLIKDPYQFDFLTLAPDAAERDLELGLLDKITRFLIELGAGFSFVGRQVPIEVDGQIFSIDLLFYHLHLRCFIVIDLKTSGFQPEYAGKMNFYLSAVDDQMRHQHDAPSIGLILCKTRSKVIAEYALRHMARPIGVTRYETKLTEKLPMKLARQLPSIRQLERKLSPGTAKPKRSRRT